MRRLAWHSRCIAAAISSYLLGTKGALACVGFISRFILRSPIVSVFLLYPARKEYADALAYQWHQRRFSWHPGLVGLYRQGGRYGLIFGIPNLEEDIRAEENAPRLLDLMSRMEAAQRSVGATRKVFAGILPSLFARNGIENEHLAEQRYLTARAVLQALDQRCTVLARTCQSSCWEAAATLLQKFSGCARTAGSALSMWRSWTNFAGSWMSAGASLPSS
jgi:hypothetical protein